MMDKISIISEMPETVHGRLLESIHITGYTFERACAELEWLLEDDRWQRIGKGYEHIDDFLATLNLSEFKIAIEQRKKLGKRLAELKATQRAIAGTLGVGQATIQRDLDSNESKITQQPSKHKPFEPALDSNESIAPSPAIIQSGADAAMAARKAAEGDIKKAEREDKIQAQREAIGKGMVVVPKGKYNVVNIDPPWAYGREYDPDSSRIASPYPEMKIDQIKRFWEEPPYNQQEAPFADDCILFLWTTHRFIWDAKELINIWGFEYKAIIIWDKETMGIGSILRMQCEFCLVAMRGKPFWNNKEWRDIIRERRREHSRKPELFYQMAEAITAGEKVDIFSRGPRPGWDQYGDEPNRFAV